VLLALNGAFTPPQRTPIAEKSFTRLPYLSVMSALLPYALILTLALLAVVLRKLTVAAGAGGVLVAYCMYTGLGYGGLMLLGAFFVTGTLATSWKKRWKAEAGLGEKNGGRRSLIQVLANGGTAALAALWGWWQHRAGISNDSLALPSLLAASALSAAAADTLSSELGNVYGKRYVDIIGLRTGIRGADGVISVEGLLAGFAGSAVICLVYLLCFLPHWKPVLLILAGGTAGNLFDSLLGATLQRQGRLSNSGVNLLNTLFAASVAFLLWLLLRT